MMVARPRLLDLFSGAGGAARGYQLAGFHVTGVDIKPQPRYAGDVFIQGDALDYCREHGHEFDVIHASPPCQAFTVYGNNRSHVRSDHPDLIAPTRDVLLGAGIPYVIENVPGSPLLTPIRLCGTSFPPLEIRRHRMFEASALLLAPACNHRRLTERRYPGSSNRPNGRTVCNIGEWRVPLETQRAAIGIDWMTMEEISQAIPPAYTEFVGRQLMTAITHSEPEQAARSAA
jgi:DNA (cytosine-5)-methyltransferase 1